jgi:hypothetical protein
MTTLENMKRVGERRTKGKWVPDKGKSLGPDPEDDCDFARGPLHFGGRDSQYEYAIRDAEFIALASNKWEKLLACVEHLQSIVDSFHSKEGIAGWEIGVARALLKKLGDQE